VHLTSAVQLRSPLGGCLARVRYCSLQGERLAEYRCTTRSSYCLSAKLHKRLICTAHANTSLY